MAQVCRALNDAMGCEEPVPIPAWVARFNKRATTRVLGPLVIALTYGPEAEWVRNVLAAGGCELETGGRTLRLSQPRLFRDEQRRLMPGPVRVILGLVGVSDFLELGVESESGSPTARAPGG
jgi:hypothetical protein